MKKTYLHQVESHHYTQAVLFLNQGEFGVPLAEMCEDHMLGHHPLGDRKCLGNGAMFLLQRFILLPILKSRLMNQYRGTLTRLPPQEKTNKPNGQTVKI